jgi:hypothetical protein
MEANHIALLHPRPLNHVLCAHRVKPEIVSLPWVSMSTTSQDWRRYKAQTRHAEDTHRQRATKTYPHPETHADLNVYESLSKYFFSVYCYFLSKPVTLLQGENVRNFTKLEILE